MARKTAIAVTAAVLIAAAIFFFQNQPKVLAPPLYLTLSYGEVRIRDAVYAVEIADTPELQARGLSGRSELRAGHGMYFFFPEAGPQTFWMKDMQFPLDFVWIRERRVVGVNENAPADDGKILYPSPASVDGTLEVRAGEVARHGIRAGDVVEFKVSK